MNQHPLFLIVDLFGGGGGDATGFEQAELLVKYLPYDVRQALLLNFIANDKGGGSSISKEEFEEEFENQVFKIAKVIVCVNHDEMALKTHSLNYPHVIHFREDIRTVDLTEIKSIVDYHRGLHPDAKLIVWGSFPCPHFSKALGNKPKDEGIRTMAKSLYMNFCLQTDSHIPGNSYIQVLDPDYIMVENVEEFKTWGPLDDNCRPIAEKYGEYFTEWRKDICSFGYSDSWQELNSADFGAHTSRNRLFGIFAKPDMPIAWPSPTHTQHPERNNLFGTLEKWKPVKDLIDFNDAGTSIINRKKRLAENTIKGIIKGIKKFALNGEEYFLFHYYGNSFTTSINTVCPTFRTKQSAYLIQAFIHNPSHGGNCTSINKPCPVIVARQDKAPLRLVTCIQDECKLIIEDSDSPAYKELKELMNEYGIADVLYRPLRVQEKKIIQGFPPEYLLCGNQAQTEKQIGNSVVPLVAKVIAEAIGSELLQTNRKKAA